MRPIVTDRVAWSVSQLVCRSVTVVSLQKTAEPIEMLLGICTQVARSLRKHVIGGVHTGATWRIPLNHPCGGDAAYCQITLTTCYYCYCYLDACYSCYSLV